jgi:GDP-D-mannose 3', 5'-epimerase
MQMQDENRASNAQVIAVAGGGGFIGANLVQRLLADGEHHVRVIDYAPLDDWHNVSSYTENLVLDLKDARACDVALDGVDIVYNLAADMGGMGFIEANKARCMLSVLINTHLLQSARRRGVSRFFFSSSACVYAADHQLTPDIQPLSESSAYPADPEDGYGWEKLFSERMCRHFTEDFGLLTRVARYHNVYGPRGAWTGGREKAPAAICRKIAEAKLSGQHQIEIWGDGEQTRSFMFIDDCIEGTRRIMDSEIDFPINLGSSEMVSINQLVTLIEEIAGITVRRRYALDAPTGVRGRNSDNTVIQQRLGWEPTISLRAGLEATYAWIHDQVISTLDYVPRKNSRAG